MQEKYKLKKNMQFVASRNFNINWKDFASIDFFFTRLNPILYFVTCNLHNTLQMLSSIVLQIEVTSDLLGYHVFHLQQPLWPMWREMSWQTIWLHTLGQRMIKKWGSGLNLNQLKHKYTTLTNHCGLQVYIYCSGNMTPWAPSIKECVEWVFTRV